MGHLVTPCILCLHLQRATMFQEARRSAPLALASLLVGFGIGALLTWPSALNTGKKAISMNAAPLTQASRVAPRSMGMEMARAREIQVFGGKKAGAKMDMIGDDFIRNNLEGKSRFMSKKGWIDAQGREGKGYGVYRFANKYGANIDGYSPIYQPSDWSDSGDTFQLGTKGLIAWAGLIVVLLGAGGFLIVQSSTLN